MFSRCQMVMLLRVSVLCAWMVVQASALSDPWGIFCGDVSCYDVLGVESDAPIKEIKKQYRTLSLQWHPDKNKEPEAAVKFQKIAKAYTVLSDVEQRKLYDRYTDHPEEYWSAYGHYVVTVYAPKADVKLVILGFVVFLSVVQQLVQWNKYQQAVKYLRIASLNGWGLQQGGTKQTLEIHRRACEEYERLMNTETGKKRKLGSKSKGVKDEEFAKIVNQLVDEVKIEGGHRKPVLEDALIVQIILMPKYLYRWATLQYRLKYKQSELTREDKESLAKKRVGHGTWDNLTNEDRDACIERQVWKEDAYANWVTEREEVVSKAKRPGVYKRNTRSAKRTEDSD